MKHRIVSISLTVILALAVGLVGCGGEEVPEYSLTISSTEGGSVTAPGEETSTYDEGEVVNLLAEADEGYRFVNWTAPVGAFANATASLTTFTMPARNVTVTANFAPFAAGNGTEGDPYQIADWYQLHMVRNYRDSHFILVNNLDSSAAGYTERASPTANDGKGWQPVGGIEIIDPDPLEFELVDPFAGNFDGRGYEIRDLFIHRPDEAAVALFGSVAGRAIENAKLLDANITGNFGVGILVGANLGSVSSSCSSGSVGGYYGVGGLIGGNFGNVSDSRSRAAVNGAGDGSGGLVGFNAGYVDRCYATGNVSGGDSVGGLVGMNGEDNYYGTVTHSYASGDVNGTSYVGGLVGQSRDGSVSYSYSTGSVTGNESTGGLVGWNRGTVSNSYSSGSVTSERRIGGLVGWNEEGSVTDSFWDIETSGQATSAGGTGKTTSEMKSIATFTSAAWNIVAVANPDIRNLSYIWNILDGQTYPFLSWQSIS